MVNPEEPKERDKTEDAQVDSWNLVVYIGKEYKGSIAGNWYQLLIRNLDPSPDALSRE